jgi:hypothetical protein
MPLAAADQTLANMGQVLTEKRRTRNQELGDLATGSVRRAATRRSQSRTRGQPRKQCHCVGPLVDSMSLFAFGFRILG